MSKSDLHLFYAIPNKSLSAIILTQISRRTAQVYEDWRLLNHQRYSDFLLRNEIMRELQSQDAALHFLREQLKAEKEASIVLPSVSHKNIVPTTAFLGTLLVSAYLGVYSFIADIVSVLYHSAGGLAWRVQQETLHEKAKIKQSKNKTSYSKTTEKIELCFG